jgi:hypothetical protein
VTCGGVARRARRGGASDLRRAAPASVTVTCLPANCFVLAQLVKQQCLMSGRNALYCQGKYIAGLFLCVKGLFLDKLF